jgi:hypothetical protein
MMWSGPSGNSSMGPVWLAEVAFLVPLCWSAYVVRALVEIPKQNKVMVFSLKTIRTCLTIYSL